MLPTWLIDETCVVKNSLATYLMQKTLPKDQRTQELSAFAKETAEPSQEQDKSRFDQNTNCGQIVKSCRQPVNAVLNTNISNSQSHIDQV